MQMGSMGGPVGGGAPQSQPGGGAGTPGGPAAGMDMIKRLNTAIYDYLLRNELYDSARHFYKGVDVEVAQSKSPASQRGGQSNGVTSDGIDLETNNEIKNRPQDLPLPAQLGDGPFLQDWWCQFWEIYQGQRNKGKQTTRDYIGTQRQAQKARLSVHAIDPASMNNMRQYNGMMNNGGGMLANADMKRIAMQQQNARTM